MYVPQKGLHFLNADCQLVHGNISLSSVFVNKAGDWKLGGLEFVCSVSDGVLMQVHLRVILIMPIVPPCPPLTSALFFAWLYSYRSKSNWAMLDITAQK